jgi:hypothetical protein
MRRTASALLPGIALLLAAAPARAQYPGAPPQVSPYLNLVRGGSPGINYYGLIRPQQQLQMGLQNVQAALINEQQFAGAQEALATQPVITGNYATYQTQNRYFMTRGGGGFGQRPIGFPGGYGAVGGFGASGGPGAAGAMPGYAGPTAFPSQPAGLQSGRPPQSGRPR